MTDKARRIALFLPSLNGGGAEKVMLNLARGFLAQEFEVDLVLSDAKGEYLSQVPTGINIIGLKAKRVLKSVFKLAAYLREKKPDILISALSHANLIALWAKALAPNHRTKVVVCEHSTLSQSIIHPKNFRDRIVPFLMKYFYRLAHAIVAVSEGVADDLSKVLRLNRDLIKVIYNPIVDDRLKELSKEKLEHPWFQAGQPPVVLAVGRLTEAKDFSTLIKAYNIVQDKLPAHLLILGEGEKRHELESLVKELKLQNHVLMPGFVDNPYKYMKAASVFVLSSKWEGLPNVLIEALACGTRVVATDCQSGPSEILNGGEFGLLIQVGDSEAMAQAIITQLNSTQNDNLLLKRANDFHIDVVVKQYLDISD